MAGKMWTDAECWALQRAIQLYDRQPKLIAQVEPVFEGRGHHSLVYKTGQIDDWQKPDDCERLDLLAETDPEQAARRTLELCRDPRSRMVVPGWVSEELPKEEVTKPPPRPDPTNRRILELERERTELRARLADEKRKLKATQRDETLFRALAQVVSRNTDPLPPLRYDPPKRKAGGTKLDAVLIWSDQHADAIISAAGTWGMEEYDFDIFRCRLHRLIDMVGAYVTSYLPAHDFERLWIFHLGDAVQGDLHGMKDRNSFPNTLKAALAVGDAQAQAVQALLPLFPGGVHLVGVPGNHPRRSKRKDYHGAHDNFDYLVVQQMAARLLPEIDAGRCSIHTPDAFSAYVDVRGHLWALNHGDDVRGYAGFPWYGYSRKNARVQSMIGQRGRRVSYFAYGHFHTDTHFTDMGAVSYHSGNWTWTDPYAVEKVSAGSPPIQRLLGLTGDEGVVLEVPIYLCDPDAEQRFREGGWEPAFGRELVQARTGGGAEFGDLPVVSAT